MTHLLFIYCFSLSLVALASFDLHKRRLQGLRWDLFCLFAALNAVHIWFELMLFVYPGIKVLSFVSVCLEAASYLCLLAFGRLSIKEGFFCNFGRWIYVLLLGCALVVLILDFNLFQNFVFSLFGFCGALLAAYAIGKHESRLRITSPLTWLAFSLVVYSLHPLFLARLVSAQNITVLNQISDIANHPILGMVCLSMIVMLASAWLYIEQLCKSQVPSDSSFKYCYCFRKLLVAQFIVLTVGIGATEYIAKDSDQIHRSNLLGIAKLIASAVDATKVGELHGQREDMESRAYKELDLLLKGFGNSQEKLRYLYIMGKDEDGIKYFLDTEPDRYADEDLPCETGEVYAEATEDLKNLYNKGDALVEGPVTDEWGVWISGLVPLVNVENNNVLGVLGVDIDARQWIRDVGKSRFEPLIITLLIGLTISTLCIVLQKFREHAANEIENRYQSLVEGSPNAVMLFDKDGICTLVNNAGIDLLGISREKVTGKKITDYWAESQRLAVDKGLARFEATKKADFQVNYKSPDGDEKTFDVVLNRIPGSQMLAGGFVATLADVTARKLAEMALKESELKFKTLFDNASDSILLACAGLLVDSNQRAVSMFGYHQEQLANRWPQAVSPELQPDGSRSGLKLVEYGDLAMAGTPQTFKWTFQRKDETCFEAEVFMTRIEIGGTTFLETIIRAS